MASNHETREVPSRVQHELLSVHGLHVRSRVQGGLSAAKLWFCSGGDRLLACLRCWPPEHPSENGLRMIHAAQQRANDSSLAFVPRVFTTSTGASIVHCDGSMWELTQWMPGTADYLRQPSVERLTNAVHALADLHSCWHAWMPSQGPCRAVEKRIELLAVWLNDSEVLATRIQSDVSRDEQVLCTETCQALRLFGPGLLDELRAVRKEVGYLQPVLRDIWSDHVLFVGNEVTGLIDYGALAIDTPATDLARLLGSLEPEDRSLRQLALDRYRARTGFQRPSWNLVDLLDRSSTLLAAAQWMEWLAIQQRVFTAQRKELVVRWRALLARANRICASHTSGSHRGI